VLQGDSTYKTLAPTKTSSDLPSFKSTCTCGSLNNKIKDTHKQYLREELKIGLLSKLANEGCVVTDVWVEELNGSADPKSATNLLEGPSGVNMFSLEVGAEDCKKNIYIFTWL
jgi:hypothetical protein